MCVSPELRHRYAPNPMARAPPSRRVQIQYKRDTTLASTNSDATPMAFAQQFATTLVQITQERRNVLKSMQEQSKVHITNLFNQAAQSQTNQMQLLTQALCPSFPLPGQVQSIPAMPAPVWPSAQFGVPADGMPQAMAGNPQGKPAPPPGKPAEPRQALPFMPPPPTYNPRRGKPIPPQPPQPPITEEIKRARRIFYQLSEQD